MTVQRYDFSSLSPDVKARLDGNGFLYDSPVVARTGILEYKNPDGTIRRELRMPEDVFAMDALATFSGKPITVDHPGGGIVNSKNVHKLIVGTMMSAGRQDGDYARADIVIHSPESIGERRQLSLGYIARLEETPGIWNGERYDAIQRDIRVNHLSVVKVARAGAIARLNLDGNEDFPNPPQEQKTMTTVKVKLDNGIEYDAAPEVSVELARLRADAAEAAKKLNAAEKLQVEKDMLQAKADGFDAELAKAKEAGKAEAIARVKLDSFAASMKIDAAGKSDKEIKELVIKAVTPKLNLDGKSDAYIDAAFDVACATGVGANMAGQRKAGVHTDAGNVVQLTSAQRRDAMIKTQYLKQGE